MAVGTFGLRSAEALAATVGPLIEVPALMALVYVALWARDRFWARRDAELAKSAAGGGAPGKPGGGGGEVGLPPRGALAV